MSRLYRIFVCFLIALLPLQAMAAFSAPTCDMAQMQQMMDDDCPCPHEGSETDKGSTTSHAGCGHCMACFAGGATALLVRSIEVGEPVADSYETLEPKRLLSLSLEPPIQPPR